jgi:hypothetical protein
MSADSFYRTEHDSLYGNLTVSSEAGYPDSVYGNLTVSTEPANPDSLKGNTRGGVAANSTLGLRGGRRQLTK